MISAIQRNAAAQAFTSVTPVRQASGFPSAPTQLAPQDQLQRSHAAGKIPASIGLFASAPVLQDSLKKLNASPREADMRAAQAHFRVQIRNLDLTALQALALDLNLEISQTSNFRTQRFMHAIQSDLQMEIFSKGGQTQSPAPGMPPVPGNTPQTIINGTLNQLNSHQSESNFKTAQAGFRVALRQLSPEQLLETRANLQAAIVQNSDYRTQLLLDGLSQDILMEQITRGLPTDSPAVKMPPALGNNPQAIAQNALALLQANPSEAQFKTALAAVRVARRQLNPAQQAELSQRFTTQMNQTSDYRSQVFLDQAARQF